MAILDELKKRGILDNVTNEEKLSKLKKGDGVYIGFDPTASSLHLGNYIQIAILKRFSQFGFKPIAILGGATGMIGDPSGKSAERNLLDKKQLEINKKSIKNQLEKFGLTVVDNYDFYKDMNVLDFFREVGKLLNVNYMVSKDVVKSRLESGISFTEFSYQLIQGWDFKTLFDNNNVRIQVGGSDQWGNITSGLEVIRKTNGANNAVGITTKLLTTSSGKKFGKSEKGAIFLDKNLTTPYQMYQFVLNTSDEDVEKLLLWLTNLDIEKIDTIMKEHSREPFKRNAQKTLASEILKDIHGKSALEESIKISNILFGKIKIDSLDKKDASLLENIIPTSKGKSNSLVDVLVEAEIVTSKRQAREFIQNNSIEVNGIKVNDIESKIDFEKFGNFAIIKKGKKVFHFVIK